MKIVFVGLLLFSILSGVTLAQQSEEQRKPPSSRGMMQDMMKGEQSGQGSKEGMGNMGGMMRMMKMMDQCAGMMESCCGAPGNEKGKENQNK
jgi:hypothetical protein